MNRSPDSIVPACDVIPVTPADADLPDGKCRGLLVGAAGAANFW